MIKDLDYYIDSDGNWAFTAAYHKARGYCCGNVCKHCPFNDEGLIDPLKKNAPLIKAAATKTASNTQLRGNDGTKEI